ncbi:MAG: helix-turn-helix domain-containing protein [Pseudomonadota bacterium]|nr:helix-turn-helix domain-containing protein [Pseudomonadota bacterium]
MIDKKNFNNFLELGTFIKKKRRETGERIESISSKLIIKKTILQNIENGTFTQIDYEKNSYLKGFLKTYMKELGVIHFCYIENLFSNNSVEIKKTRVSVDNSKIKKSKYGSMIILSSLILIGLLFLIWNRNTYYDLYELEKFLK